MPRTFAYSSGSSITIFTCLAEPLPLFLHHHFDNPARRPERHGLAMARRFSKQAVLAGRRDRHIHVCLGSESVGFVLWPASRPGSPLLALTATMRLVDMVLSAFTVTFTKFASTGRGTSPMRQVTVECTIDRAGVAGFVWCQPRRQHVALRTTFGTLASPLFDTPNSYIPRCSRARASLAHPRWL